MRDNDANTMDIDAPIPGQSLTAPLGERPWQNPPRFSTVEETLKFYVPRLTEEKMSGKLLDMLDMGVPIDTVVDTVQLNGVMEGVHSVDVGMLVSPVLVEVVEKMAKDAGIDYVLEGKEVDEDAPDASMIAAAKMKADKLKDVPVQEEPVVEEVMEEPKPKGLMARRVADGI